ncbi:MAG: biopolymer transporter ExbD, partial [Oscillospiraceae bacterium]|nr:biopolymer transporter ExbD [Oscillospiraceae bacterium]
MKKRREIILDFTSLLDVIMIILFFFILNSHFQAEEAKKKMATAQSAADAQSAEAEQREREAEKLISQATEAEKKAIDAYNRLANQDSRSAQNYDALKAFEEGRHLRLYLSGTGGTWSLCFDQGGESISVPIGETLADDFRTAFRTFGYTPDSTILCEFQLDASARGSKGAYEAVS